MYVPTRTYPHDVPPHDCPGRTVTCPDCGQHIRVAPKPVQFPQMPLGIDRKWIRGNDPRNWTK